MRHRNLGGTTDTIAAEAPAGRLGAGLADLAAGLRRWPVWWSLTWRSVRSQYRRTYLGPWWITLQSVVFVAGLSLLFGVLLQQELPQFVPYVAVGFMAFTWMTGMVQAGASSIVGNGAAIATEPGPASTYVLRGFAGPTIQFAHDAVVIALVLVLFEVPVGWSLALVPVALAVVAVNGIAVGLWLGPLVARYRDVGEIVAAVTRVAFFFTPVFWVASDLTREQLVAIAGWNPFAYLLQFVRDPLLGTWPSTTVVAGVVVVTVLNVIAGIVRFSRTRDRLAYWL